MDLKVLSELTPFEATEAPASKTRRENTRLLFQSPLWTQIVPFFLSAILFLSFFLVIFAPLPLLLFSAGKYKKWFPLAILSNCLIVFWVGHFSIIGYYFVLAIIPAVTLAICTQKKASLEKSVAFTLLGMLTAGAAVLIIYCLSIHVNPIHEVQNSLKQSLDMVGQALVSHSVLNEVDLEDKKNDFLNTFPSNIAIFSLILVWANLTLFLRLNPNQVREKMGLDVAFIKKWKVSEYLVWPVIFLGLLLLLDLGIISTIAMNLFNFLMAIYWIQGLSILSHIFDVWGVRGILRLLGYSLSILMMTPLILSLGFFDLWFDFRTKLRQS